MFSASLSETNERNSVFITLIFKAFPQPSPIHILTHISQFSLKFSPCWCPVIYALSQTYPVLLFLHPHSPLCCLPMPLPHYLSSSKALLVLQVMTPIPTNFRNLLRFFCFLNFHSTLYFTLVTYSTLPSTKIFICCQGWGVEGKGNR